MLQAQPSTRAGASSLPSSRQRFCGLPHQRRRRNNFVLPKISAPEKSPLTDSEEAPLVDLEPEDDTFEGQECSVFIDRDGEFIPVMCCDYGFRSGAGRMYQAGYGKIPSGAWALAVENFDREWRGLRRSVRYDEYQELSELKPAQTPLGKVGAFIGRAMVDSLAMFDRFLESKNIIPKLHPRSLNLVNDIEPMTTECREILGRLRGLTLSNQAVWDREHKREDAGMGVPTPWFVKVVYLALCVFLDKWFEDRPIPRFWFLETVARMPYFSYISMLHLYESFGWWRAGAELRKVHFAEEWNELHHLQIMETLGGDRLWVDRFMAQHAAIVYYWILLLMYLVSPSLAYNFSELIEAHAVDTYGQFADENEALLKSIPPPVVAAKYYRSSDLYFFDEFQTSRTSTRRPACSSLYDVFCNIRDDEGEHVATMKACQDYTIMEDLEERMEKEREL